MNYTYAQLKQMQEDASRRVMEMRRRADVAAGQSDEDMALDLPGPDRAPGPSRAAKKTDDENERALILALMALLEAEKADKGLLLALAYVLE
ncbi:MAG: hypothetical protein IJL26_02775 [Clostridia bacterium]|nr:hypothetical protein [Clostridia bacterium]